MAPRWDGRPPSTQNVPEERHSCSHPCGLGTVGGARGAPGHTHQRVRGTKNPSLMPTPHSTMPVPFAAGPDLLGGQLITFLLQLRWPENGLNDLTLSRFACAFIEMPLFGNQSKDLPIPHCHNLAHGPAFVQQVEP